MSILTKYLLGKLTYLGPEQLQGIKILGLPGAGSNSIEEIDLPASCEIIGANVFTYCKKLKKITLPNSIKRIGPYAFASCEALETAILNLPSECLIDTHAFHESKFYNNATENIYSSDGGILIKGVTADLLPSTINLGPQVGNNFVVNSQLTIPDQIQIICGHIGGSPTSMIIGENVRFMWTDAIPTTVTTLVSKQPSSKYVELPPSGEGKGLSHDKNSRNMTIYTDNEYIKNYDWAGDNITATFYPLSQAPQ